MLRNLPISADSRKNSLKTKNKVKILDPDMIRFSRILLLLDSFLCFYILNCLDCNWLRSLLQMIPVILLGVIVVSLIQCCLNQIEQIWYHPLSVQLID